MGCKVTLEERNVLEVRHEIARAEGFEPTSDGTKNRCLTTWRRPNFKETFAKNACCSHAFYLGYPFECADNRLQ